MLPTSPISLLVKRGIPRSRYIFRTMSQAAPDNLHKFFVYAPDRKEECTHTTRYAVRPQHLKDLDSHLLTKGYLPIQVGGMLVTPEEMESETGPKKAEGSLLIIKAGTIAEARKLIESDVYFTSGVWDSEKIIILPFVPATPFP